MIHRCIPSAVRATRALALLSLLIARVDGQCPDVWSLVATDGPPAGEAAMAFDEARGVSVLVSNGETWTWDGAAWMLAATNGPAARTGFTLSYDPLRARTVLFGGSDGSTEFGDTWEWDGNAWSLVASSGPAARSGHAAAYNIRTSTITLFGGHPSATGAFGDTWDWNGASWSQRSVIGTPSARSNAALARSSGTGTLLLYGGVEGANSIRMSDIWRISTLSWGLLDSCAISAREQAALAFDSTRERAVLFGGLGGDGELKAETWEYENEVWKPVSWNGPSARRAPALAYDSQRERMILFGGIAASGPNGETWEFSAVDVPATPTDPEVVEVRKGIALVTWAPHLSASNTTLEREHWSGASWIDATTAGVVAPGPTRWLDLPGTGAFRYRIHATSCAGSSGWSAPIAVLPAAPGAPTGGLVKRNTATLTWSDRSDFEESFEVERQQSTAGTGGPWLSPTIVAVLAADTTTYSQRPGIGTWRYRLRSTNVGGSSDWTPWLIVTIR